MIKEAYSYFMKEAETLGFDKQVADTAFRKYAAEAGADLSPLDAEKRASETLTSLKTDPAFLTGMLKAAQAAGLPPEQTVRSLLAGS